MPSLPPTSRSAPRGLFALAWPLAWMVLGTSAVGWAVMHRGPRDTPDARLADGPWGRIERRTVVLEPPSRVLSPAQCDTSPTTWRMAGRTRAEAAQLLADAGIDPATRDALLAGPACDAGGCTVLPDDATVLSLAPDRRAALYRVLGATPANPEQFQPLSLPSDERELWFGAGALGDEAARLLGRLSWQEDGAVRVADLRVLCRALPLDERMRLVRVLERQPGEILELVVAPGADVDALAAWWERGRPAESVRPLISALARQPGGGRVDVTQLLPRFARARIDRYPTRDERGQDCNFTALNFFAQEPDARFLDPEVTARAWASEFQEVPLAEAALGDAIVVRRDGAQVHAAVYVAADEVFTKNGATTRAPWALMRLRNLRALYPGELHVLRRRGPLG